MVISDSWCDDMSRVGVQPLNRQDQDNIDACQAANDTPWCWPLSDTRICITREVVYPNVGYIYIRYFWPPNYYPNDTLIYLDAAIPDEDRALNRTVNLDWDTEWSGAVSAQDGVMEIKQYFDRDIYDNVAFDYGENIDQKRLQMYMVQRSASGLVTYGYGPQFTLTKEVAWHDEPASTSSRTSSPTATNTSSGNGIPGEENRLEPKFIPLIVIVLFITVAIVVLLLRSRRQRQKRLQNARNIMSELATQNRGTQTPGLERPAAAATRRPGVHRPGVERTGSLPPPYTANDEPPKYTV